MKNRPLGSISHLVYSTDSSNEKPKNNATRKSSKKKRHERKLSESLEPQYYREPQNALENSTSPFTLETSLDPIMSSSMISVPRTEVFTTADALLRMRSAPPEESFPTADTLLRARPYEQIATADELLRIRPTRL